MDLAVDFSGDFLDEFWRRGKKERVGLRRDWVVRLRGFGFGVFARIAARF